MALTPTQLDKLPEPVIQLMSELQDEIISDICRRIKKTNLLTPTAEWQLIKANQLTLSSQEVKRRIAAKLKISDKSVKELYTDAVKTAIREDEKIYKFAMADGILSGDYREKLTNYTRSVAFSNALKKDHKSAMELIEAYKKAKGDPPEYMLEFWKEKHEEFMEKYTRVKCMIEVFDKA